VSLITLFILISMFFGMGLMTWFINFTNTDHIFYAIKVVTYGSALAVFLMYIISAVTGYRDERVALDATQAHPNVTRFSAVILTLFGASMLVYQWMILSAWWLPTQSSRSIYGTRSDTQKNPHRTSTMSGAFSQPDSFFWNGVPLKSYDPVFQKSNLPDPPKGEASLEGEFHLDGKPIPHLTFDMVLDSKYRAKNITTDDNGIFHIAIKPGTWHMDYLHVTAWPDKPADRKLMLLSGREAKLNRDIGLYESFSLYRYNSGIPVTVTPKPDSYQHPIFIINDKVSLLVPNAHSNQFVKDSTKYAVRWRALPNVKTYLVQFNVVTREGTSSSYHSVAEKRVVGATEYKLSQLNLVPHQGGDNPEYQVKIFAFDDQGNFLSESSDSLDSANFILTDGKQIYDRHARYYAEENIDSKSHHEVRENNKRLDAVKILIQDKLYKEATALLGKVSGDTEPGKKDAITGYLLAEQKRCREADQYFAKAKKENPSLCVPECYRKKCN